MFQCYVFICDVFLMVVSQHISTVHALSIIHEECIHDCFTKQGINHRFLPHIQVMKQALCLAQVCVHIRRNKI